MTMKRSDDFQELWRDTLDEGLPKDFAGESLAEMLGSARRRKQRKRAVRAGLGAALVVPVLMMMMHRTPEGGSEPGRGVAPVAESEPLIEPLYPPVGPPGPPVAKAAVVETIGDEELLAAFDGRPVVLVGTGDAKQVLLLDKGKPR